MIEDGAMNQRPGARNREQIEYWNGPRGASWVAEQDMRDRALAPFGDAVLQRARAVAGERVIDIGCGCGATTLALAAAVGPRGAVLGVDVSEPMLARARERAAELSQVSFQNADAATFAFGGDAALLYSRFGVMFFDDPRAAFANLKKALASGGRLAFVCWRDLRENAWMSVPFAAVKEVVKPTQPPPPPDAPGPLAFADPARVRSILEGAGFGEVELAQFDHAMPIGDGRGLDAAAADAASMGPAARLLGEASDEVRARAVAAVRTALAPYARGDDVALSAAAWVVSARS
jgi:SAM-dependent methyltransferase